MAKNQKFLGANIYNKEIRMMTKKQVKGHKNHNQGPKLYLGQQLQAVVVKVLVMLV